MGMPESEEWRDVIGYEGFYKVSNLGRIWSNWTNKILKQHTNNTTGYLVIWLCNGKEKPKIKAVHRIVAFAFVEGYKKGFCVNHKNEIKTDNRATNLEWCTNRQNLMYNNLAKRKAQTEGHKKQFRACQRKAWKQFAHKTVIQFSLLGEKITCYSSLTDAEKQTGISKGSIQNVCVGRTKTAGGYKWRYA